MPHQDKSSNSEKTASTDSPEPFWPTQRELQALVETARSAEENSKAFLAQHVYEVLFRIARVGCEGVDPSIDAGKAEEARALAMYWGSCFINSFLFTSSHGLPNPYIEVERVTKWVCENLVFHFLKSEEGRRIDHSKGAKYHSYFMVSENSLSGIRLKVASAGRSEHLRRDYAICTDLHQNRAKSSHILLSYRESSDQYFVDLSVGKGADDRTQEMGSGLIVSAVGYNRIIRGTEAEQIHEEIYRKFRDEKELLEFTVVRSNDWRAPYTTTPLGLFEIQGHAIYATTHKRGVTYDHILQKTSPTARLSVALIAVRCMAGFHDSLKRHLSRELKQQITEFDWDRKRLISSRALGDAGVDINEMWAYLIGVVRNSKFRRSLAHGDPKPANMLLPWGGSPEELFEYLENDCSSSGMFAYLREVQEELLQISIMRDVKDKNHQEVPVASFINSVFIDMESVALAPLEFDLVRFIEAVPGLFTANQKAQLFEEYRSSVTILRDSESWVFDEDVYHAIWTMNVVDRVAKMLQGKSSYDFGGAIYEIEAYIPTLEILELKFVEVQQVKDAIAALILLVNRQLNE